MPANYKILSEARLKHVVVEGKTDFEELQTLFFDFLRDPDFEPDLRILADLRDMTDAVAGLWEIKKLKELYQYAYHDVVRAVDVVIITRGGLAYRAARAFQLMMVDKRPLVIKITDSIAVAQKLLALSDSELAQLYPDSYSDAPPQLHPQNVL
jgi:hypothetical protein